MLCNPGNSSGGYSYSRLNRPLCPMVIAPSHPDPGQHGCYIVPPVANGLQPTRCFLSIPTPNLKRTARSSCAMPELPVIPERTEPSLEAQPEPHPVWPLSIVRCAVPLQQAVSICAGPTLLPKRGVVIFRPSDDRYLAFASHLRAPVNIQQRHNPFHRGRSFSVPSERRSRSTCLVLRVTCW